MVSLVCGGLVAVLAGIILLVVTLARRWPAVAKVFARQWRLPYSPDIEAWVIRRIRIRLTAQLVVLGLLGGAVSAVLPYLLLTGSTSNWQFTDVMLDAECIAILSVFPLAAVIGHGLDAAVTNRRPGPRVARLSAVSLTDVTPPAMIWTVRTLSCLPLAVLPLWLLPAGQSSEIWPHHPWPVAVVVAVAVPVAGLLVEAWQRRIVNGPQRAANGLELAYDDAFRVSVVHGLFLVTVWVAALGVSVVAAPALFLAPHRTLGDYMAVTFGPIAAAVAIQLLTETPWMRTYFRGRLTPVPAPVVG